LAGGAPALRFEHDANASGLLPTVAVGALLTVITLGFYRFWLRTGVRRYLWGRTRFAGDALVYAGTAGELFVGFLVVFVYVLLPLAVVNGLIELAIADEESPVYTLADIAYVLLIVFLIYLGGYRSRRYLLSRTRWRSIRAGMAASGVAYAANALLLAIGTGLTLGWLLPAMHVALDRRLTRDTRFGDRAFEFDGRAGPLYGRFALAWLLFLPTLGLSYVWYRAHEMRYLWSCTRFEGLGFAFDVRVLELLGLWLGNALILVLTLGLGAPFAQMRTIGFWCRNLSVSGTADFDAIRQSSLALPQTGEGLADAFDATGI
jgi:uncharacterized membrane protein YjgN (DUF898 family)